MLSLYLSPGSSSLASHIALEESGAEYEPRPTVIAKGEHKTPEYLRINPRGRVPALVIEDGRVVTENVAILAYIAMRFPDAHLMPEDNFEVARWLLNMAWLSNTVHPTFTHIFRPQAYSDEEVAHGGIKEAGRKNYWTLLKEIDGMLPDRKWFLGDQFTTCDPYALVFFHWGTRSGFPMDELAHYTAWKERMLQRPAVLRILRRENNVTILPEERREASGG